jgi:hypothetical protein
MRGNPLYKFISNEIYEILWSEGFLNERAIRDYYLKQQFQKLKKKHSPREIFMMLREEFPYLSVDTVRKIIYSKNGNKIEY